MEADFFFLLLLNHTHFKGILGKTYKFSLKAMNERPWQ